MKKVQENVRKDLIGNRKVEVFSKESTGNRKVKMLSVKRSTGKDEGGARK